MVMVSTWRRCQGAGYAFQLPCAVLCRVRRLAVQVDYAGGLTRIPKMSAWWLSQHFFKPGAAGVDGSQQDDVKAQHRDEI